MTVRAYKLGALGQDDLTGVKSLMAEVAASNYRTLQSPSGTNYQVTSGTNLYITMLSMSGGDINKCIVGYGDIVANNSSSAPTNWIQISAEFQVAGTGVSQQSIPVLLVVPQQKYPCIKEASGATPTRVNAYGIEAAM